MVAVVEKVCGLNATIAGAHSRLPLEVTTHPLSFIQNFLTKNYENFLIECMIF
jgi:hypothetical protein